MSTENERVQAAWDFIRKQLTESSTIRGLLVVAGAGSVAAGWLDPEKFPLVMLAVGVIGLLLPDDLPEWPWFRWPSWLRWPWSKP